MTNDNIEPSGSSSDRIELQVLGISFSQLQSGAYALILAEKNGQMRLPIVVGGMEAQAIAIRIEGITPPRPMTHDLIASLMHAFSLQLLEVFIYKFEDGIFSSEMTFIDLNGREAKLDARTSDAIAIALRTGAPIFTTATILRDTGFKITPADEEEAEIISGEDDCADAEPADPEAALHQRIASLKERIARAIESEAYEEAARLTKELNDLQA